MTASPGNKQRCAPKHYPLPATWTEQKELHKTLEEQAISWESDLFSGPYSASCWNWKIPWPLGSQATYAHCLLLLQLSYIHISWRAQDGSKNMQSKASSGEQLVYTSVHDTLSTKKLQSNKTDLSVHTDRGWLMVPPSWLWWNTHLTFGLTGQKSCRIHCSKCTQRTLNASATTL